MIFRHNGFFAFKHFILKLNNGFVIDQLFCDIVQCITKLEICQKGCKQLGNNARILIPQNTIRVYSPDGLSSTRSHSLQTQMGFIIVDQKEMFLIQ